MPRHYDEEGGGGHTPVDTHTDTHERSTHSINRSSASASSSSSYYGQQVSLFVSLCDSLTLCVSLSLSLPLLLYAPRTASTAHCLCLRRLSSSCSFLMRVTGGHGEDTSKEFDELLSAFDCHLLLLFSRYLRMHGWKDGWCVCLCPCESVTVSVYRHLFVYTSYTHIHVYA